MVSIIYTKAATDAAIAAALATAGTVGGTAKIYAYNGLAPWAALGNIGDFFFQGGGSIGNRIFMKTTSTVWTALDSASLSNPMTGVGDLIIGSTNGNPVRLAGSLSTAKNVLVSQSANGSSAAAPSWQQLGVSDIVGALALQTTVRSINVQTVSSYTVALTDIGGTIEMNLTVANAVIIPPAASVSWQAGSFFYVRQVGTGVTRVIGGSNVTVRTPNTTTLPAQWSTARIEMRGTNDWVFVANSLSTTSGGGTGGTTDPGTGTGTGGTTQPSGSATNLIAEPAIQNASNPALFTGSSQVLITADSTVAKSGGSSIKVQSTDQTQQPIYVSPTTPIQWAPITAGSTYTGYLSIRRSTALAYPADVYLIWYSSTGTQLGVSNQGTVVTTTQNAWIQLTVTATAPSTAAYAGILLEIPTTAGTLTSSDTFNVDEVGINPGTNTTWTATTTTAPTGAATVTNTGFAYTGNWTTVANPTESYSGTSGDVATISFTVGTGGGTISLRGQQGNGNGTATAKIDSNASVTISEAGTAVSNATIWTSGNITAGNHTLTITVATPDFSIMGANLSNGAFITPNAPITGGGSTSANPSGVAVPASNAYSGYTRVLAQDFVTDVAVGSFASSSAYAGYNGYDGGTSGDSGTVWSSAKTLSVSNGMLRMRQFKDSSGIYTPAVTPVINGDAWTGMQYGKWIARFRADTPSQYWKTAWLLWPNTDNWNDGEIDFPEQFFDSKIRVNVHENTGNPVNNTGANSTVTFGDGNWHTVMIEIDPGVMKFSVDGTVIYTTTDAKYIPKIPFRWALQNEMDPGTIPVGAEANVYIDWLAAFQRN